MKIVETINHPSLWKKDLRDPQSTDHKYTRGACLIIGNGCMPGALRLAAIAARRSGAGLVRITCDPQDYPILASTTWGDIITPIHKPEELDLWPQDTRFKAFLWGTGALTSEFVRNQTLRLLSSKKACVLDGGALSSFEGHHESLINHLHENVILTPHEGEFQKIFPHLESLKNKPEKALKAAQESQAVVVLKGHNTAIANPQGKIVMDTGAPATLATAGTGDVLAGLILGFLAQGLPPFQAACAGVWIQGMAASRYGLGLIAEDLLGEIPGVLKDIKDC
jgi:hydroxyethylthiazole kinase-like uncharacterized protein yjeF